MSESIFNKKTYYVLFTLVVLLLLSTLWHRFINVDDGWLAECAFYLQKLGYAKSEGMRGWLTADTKLYLFHKLFTYFGSVWGGLFGFGAYEMKSFSLLWTILCGTLLYVNYSFISENKKNGILAVILFISFHHTVELSFTYRPEMMVTFFALLSFLIYQIYLKTFRIKYLLLLGFFSGAAIATHLNGVSVAGAFVLLLWFRRKFFAGMLVGAVALWGISFFFIDVRSTQELLAFREQFINARDLSESHFGLFRYVINLLLEQGRFLHSPPEIIYTLLIVIFFALRKDVKGISDVFKFAVFVSICLGVIAHGKTPKYLLYASPFFLLWTVLSLESFARHSRLRIIGVGAILVYLSLQAIYNLNYFNSRDVDYNRLKQIASYLPKDSKVLGDTTFFFASQGKHQLQWYVIYKDQMREGKLPATAEAFFDKADYYQNEYVIVDSSISSMFSISGGKYGNFEALSLPPDDQIRVFRKVHSVDRGE